MASEFKSRLNPRRELLLQQVMDKVEPEIDKTSKTAALWKAVEKGIEWFELRDKELAAIEESKKELENRRDNWQV